MYVCVRITCYAWLWMGVAVFECNKQNKMCGRHNYHLITQKLTQNINSTQNVITLLYVQHREYEWEKKQQHLLNINHKLSL